MNIKVHVLSGEHLNQSLTQVRRIKQESEADGLKVEIRHQLEAVASFAKFDNCLCVCLDLKNGCVSHLK